ncbi:MAG: polysaccharide deacetylase family protein, partial [Granulosicoccaceae bacterium]
DSKRRLEDKLGAEVASFAYPNGNYGSREVELVREAGYRHAVTVKPGVNRRDSDPLQLRRTEVTDRDGSTELEAKLDGALDPVHRILDMKREWQFKQRRAQSTESNP